MKKIAQFLIFGFILLVVMTNAQASEKLTLNFAENCQATTGCEYFSETNGKLVKTEALSEGDRFSIDVVIKNPEEQTINSVSSWIKYDTEKLTAVSIDTDNSPFGLAAPDGDKVNEKESLVQIGRAKIGGAISDQEIVVASVVFEVKSTQKTTTTLEFSNYQQSELGNTGVFQSSGILTENILTEEPLKIELNLNQTGSTSNNDNNANTGNNNTDNNQGGIGGDDNEIVNPFDNTLTRPDGLRIKTSNSKVNLVWNNNENVNGYFVYYSTQSGAYLFRKDVGKTNNTVINDLTNNKTYYFAITAYDSRMNESDYSDEVYATVGQSGSESHPFYENTIKNGDELVDPNKGTTEETGPKQAIFIALLLTAGVIFLKKSFSLLK